MLTQEKKDKAADKRLKELYGISLAEYNLRAAAQGNKCGVCGNPPTTCRLAVDHNHRVANTKVTVTREGKIYIARASYNNYKTGFLIATNSKRAEAVANIKRSLKRLSLRGLLCFKCNKLVLGRLERVGVAPAKVIAYLQKFDPQNPLLRAA